MRPVVCVHQRDQSPVSDRPAGPVSAHGGASRGATIGANATIICGATIGRYAFIGAGAVVRGDVLDYALMLGVPARQQGWMSRHGHRLSKPDPDGIMICRESGWRYREVEPGVVRCLDWSEDQSLPVAGVILPV